MAKLLRLRASAVLLLLLQQLLLQLQQCKCAPPRFKFKSRRRKKARQNFSLRACPRWWQQQQQQQQRRRRRWRWRRLAVAAAGAGRQREMDLPSLLAMATTWTAAKPSSVALPSAADDLYATSERWERWAAAAGLEAETHAKAVDTVDAAFRAASEDNDAWDPRNVPTATATAAWLRAQVKQIQLDVPRTWASHALFARKRGRAALERLLVAWVVGAGPRARHYVQSQNYLAAMVLVVARGDENAALRPLTFLLDVMGPYYSGDLDAVREDTARIASRLAFADAELATHLLSTVEFDLLAVTPSWLLTLFFLSTRPQHAMRVVDAVFTLGSSTRVRDFLVDVCVSVLRASRALLLASRDAGDVFTALKRLDTTPGHAFERAFDIRASSRSPEGDEENVAPEKRICFKYHA